MIFSLDVRRARKGDCLLLHFGTKAKPGLVLIDGGPRGVYKPHLKPRIEDIRKARGLGKQDPLPIDILMVSHVDDDHIQGILDLTSELLQAAGTRPVQVASFWHNSFDNIIGNDPKELTAAFKDTYGAASTSKELPSDITIDADDEDLDEEVIASNLKVLASIEQGARLRGDAAKLGFPLNRQHNEKLIIAKKGGKALKIGSGLTLTVAGPMLEEIQALQKKHDNWLKKLKKEGKTPEEVLAAYVDKSVPNLSSIVVLAEVDGHSMLLTGDARGDKILKGLELIGKVKANGQLKVDVLKVPHHGSSNNLDDDFFERVIAKHYVFSGDGEHGNPERESMEMLLAARGNENYTIHLTYPIDEIDKARKEEWEKQRANEQAKKDKETDPVKKKKKVRPAWSAEKNSLTAFLKKNAAFAKKVKVADAKAPHVIDLGDPLGKAWPILV